jgi:hypothetical protein
MKLPESRMCSAGRSLKIDAAAKDVDHKMGAEERFMVAMPRQ